MPSPHIVVVGTSAGGIETLRTLVGALAADFRAPVCLVMHTAPESPGILDSILSRVASIPVVAARDGDRIKPGHIYVAIPDFHLLVEPGVLRVTRGPKENRFRPAIDPLFRSAAQVYGPGAIGVILTGNLDDGTAGLWAIKQLGGTAIVQDPDEALFPSMPASALRHVRVDHVLPVAEISRLLGRLAAAEASVPDRPHVPEQMEIEMKIAKEQNALDAGVERLGEPSSFACPECHGVLLELEEGSRLRFRCHTGHAYSVDSLLAAVTEATDDALWNAVRALEEGGLLLQKMAEHIQSEHGGNDAAQLRAQSQETHRQADAVRTIATERAPVMSKQ